MANWFTNVRKRIWQPIKKHGRSKGKFVNLKLVDQRDFLLKVKLKLEDAEDKLGLSEDTKNVEDQKFSFQSNKVSSIV